MKFLILRDETDERSAGSVLERSGCGVLELLAQSRDFAEGTE